MLRPAASTVDNCSVPPCDSAILLAPSPAQYRTRGHWRCSGSAPRSNRSQIVSSYFLGTPGPGVVNLHHESAGPGSKRNDHEKWSFRRTGRALVSRFTRTCWSLLPSTIASSAGWTSTMHVFPVDRRRPYGAFDNRATATLCSETFSSIRLGSPCASASRSSTTTLEIRRLFCGNVDHLPTLDSSELRVILKYRQESHHRRERGS